MTPDDETELQRLTSLIRTIAESSDIIANPEYLEALQKAAISLIVSFLHGNRSEVEQFYSTSTSAEPAEAPTAEDVLFRMKDPELLMEFIAEHPQFEKQIEAGSFGPGSTGELLQNALTEARKRKQAGNVAPLTRPKTEK